MDFNDNGGMIDDPKTKKEPRWDESIAWFELPDDDEVHSYRMVAKPYYFAQHWIQTYKKDGKQGKSFPVNCANFDSESGTFFENGCEVCAFLKQVNAYVDESGIKWQDLPSHIQKMGKRLTMATNIIPREIQIQGPPANNANWSFIKQAKFPQGFAKSIKEKQDKFNKVGPTVYGLNHAEYGKDLQISYNSNASEKGKMYMLELGARTPLTDEEKSHVKFLVDFKPLMKYPDQKDLADSLKRNNYYSWLEDVRSTASIPSVNKKAPASANTAPTTTTQASAGAFDSGESMSVPEEAPLGVSKAAPPQQQVTTPKQEAAPKTNSAPAPTEPPAEKPPVVEAAPVTPPPAPVAAAAPAPTPAPVVTTPAPAATAPVTGKSPIEDRLTAFAASNGMVLSVVGKTYSKPLKQYKPELAVPSCWSTYNQTMKQNNGQFCRACPLRLDCMLASS